MPMALCTVSTRAFARDLRFLSSILRVEIPHLPEKRAARFQQSRNISNSSASRHVSGASSVSQDEVSHFSRLASSWWDPHGPSRLLHLMNPLRHDFIQVCVRESSQTVGSDGKYTYLDVGCGGGIFASSAARLPTTETVTAIDPTPSVIQVAKINQRSDPALAEPRLRYLNCAIEDLDIGENSVDVLTIFEVIEHIDSPSDFLQKCTPHVKPGGWVIGSTISRSALSYLTTKIIAEAPLLGVVPRGTHDWNKYINPSEMEDWFAYQSGTSWAPLKTQGVIYIPGMGWKMVDGSEAFGNYFFGVQKLS